VPVQRRYVRSEFHVRSENGQSVVDGHGAVFNKLSQNLGGFVERVLPGAFRKTIAESDVRALFNHDSNLILARSASGTTTDGTLRLAEDATGLAYDFDVPDTSAGRDLVVSMGRGDISQSSFSWYDDDVEWSLSPEGFPLRTIIEVRRLADVSPVTYPAYLDADSGLARQAFRSLADDKHLPVEEVELAAREGRLATVITGRAVDDGPGGTHLFNAAARRARQLALAARKYPPTAAG